MAGRAVHRVDLQPFDQVFVRWRHWVVGARRVALHRIIERAHGQVPLPVRRLLVGSCRIKRAAQARSAIASTQE